MASKFLPFSHERKKAVLFSKPLVFQVVAQFASEMDVQSISDPSDHTRQGATLFQAKALCLSCWIHFRRDSSEQHFCIFNAQMHTFMFDWCDFWRLS